MLIQSGSSVGSAKGYKSFIDIKDTRLEEFLFKIMAINPSIKCEDLQEFRDRINAD